MTLSWREIIVPFRSILITQEYVIMYIKITALTKAKSFRITVIHLMNNKLLVIHSIIRYSRNSTCINLFISNKGTILLIAQCKSRSLWSELGTPPGFLDFPWTLPAWYWWQFERLSSVLPAWPCTCDWNERKTSTSLNTK